MEGEEKLRRRTILVKKGFALVKETAMRMRGNEMSREVAKWRQRGEELLSGPLWLQELYSSGWWTELLVVVGAELCMWSRPCNALVIEMKRLSYLLIGSRGIWL